MIKNFPKLVLRIKLFAKEFGTTAINIDQDININKDEYLKINEKNIIHSLKTTYLIIKRTIYYFWKK